MDRTAALMAFIKNDLLHGSDRNLRADADLLSSGIVDSLSIHKLVAFIEERFGTHVPDEDVVYENFHSVDAIVTYLARS